jgi:hypothetical protein
MYKMGRSSHMRGRSPTLQVQRQLPNFLTELRYGKEGAAQGFCLGHQSERTRSHT